MFVLIKILFDICLLRKGPEDLPANSSLMWGLVGVSLTVSIFLGMIIYDTHTAIFSSVLGLFFSFVFTKILLSKKPERFIQTFSAMLGAITLINLISLPFVAPLSNEDLDNNIATLLSLLSFAFLIWAVIVYGSIFSRAISSTFGYGIAISVGYVFLSIVIFELLLTVKVPS